MSLFGNKGTREGRTAGRSTGAADSSPGAVTHRFTLDLSRAHNLAAMLASSRASKFIEVGDLVAGMYMYEWDRLSEYWPEENRAKVEAILREMCRISPQRWNYWIQFYDAQKRRAEAGSRWQKFRPLRREEPGENPPRHSAAVRALFEDAGKTSPFRDAAGGRNMPILTMECVLLCIARDPNSEIGKKLRGSGLDLARLEIAALDPRRSPLR